MSGGQRAQHEIRKAEIPRSELGRQPQNPIPAQSERKPDPPPGNPRIVTPPTAFACDWVLRRKQVTEAGEGTLFQSSHTRTESEEDNFTPDYARGNHVSENPRPRTHHTNSDSDYARGKHNSEIPGPRTRLGATSDNGRPKIETDAWIVNLPFGKRPKSDVGGQAPLQHKCHLKTDIQMTPVAAGQGPRGDQPKPISRSRALGIGYPTTHQNTLTRTKRWKANTGKLNWTVSRLDRKPDSAKSLLHCKGRRTECQPWTRSMT